MALYVPASRRRRRSLALAVAALAVGLVVGVVAGRASAPSLTERVRSVQEDARRTASSLRVVSLHEQAGVVSSDASGDGGTDLVLSRTRTELQDEFGRAPWLASTTRQELLDQLAALAARTDRTSSDFGTAADALATSIERAFGIAGG